jgi:hypothetical protein
MWESRKSLIAVAIVAVAGSAAAGCLANIYTERFFPSIASWIICALANRKPLPLCLIIYAVVWVPIFLSYLFGAFSRP